MSLMTAGGSIAFQFCLGPWLSEQNWSLKSVAIASGVVGAADITGEIVVTLLLSRGHDPLRASVPWLLAATLSAPMFPAMAIVGGPLGGLATLYIFEVSFEVAFVCMLASTSYHELSGQPGALESAAFLSAGVSASFGSVVAPVLWAMGGIWGAPCFATLSSGIALILIRSVSPPLKGATSAALQNSA